MVLTKEEKAYILDQIGNTSYYVESFGELTAAREEKLILSIFLKIQEPQELIQVTNL